ncbi:MAG: DUF6794 domain-containing protein [Pseudomonadota bacterium]
MTRNAMISIVCFLVMPAYADEPSCIPSTFEESLSCLGEILSDDASAEFAEMPYVDLPLAHFGIGLWIRNSWIHRDDSPVAADLRDRGFLHPDDMSGVIIEAFWADARGCKFNLEEHRDYYASYWADIEAETDRATQAGEPDKPIPQCPFPLDEPSAFAAKLEAQ